MNVSGRLEKLLSLAEQLGIEIRAESMGGEGGGLCKLKGRRVLFVDIAADLATRYDRVLAGLAPLSDWENCFVVPEVRQDLENKRQQS